jgi:tetratricopeptide (TPR) repeat protein
MTMIVSMKNLKCLLLCGAAVAALTGCNGASDKQKTQREAATAQWNQARAGVMHSLASDQFKTGNFDKARATVDEALKIDPANINLHILAARISIEQNRLDLADQQLTEARKLNEKNAEALYLSGVVAQRWQKLELALDCYAKASDAQPTELAFLLARSEMLVMLNRRPEALSALQDKVIYFEHSAALRDAVGQLHMQDAKYTQAADMFRQASVLAGDDLTIRERLGTAQFFAGDYRTAADTISRLVENEAYATRTELFVMLGESHLQNGQLVQARQAFQKATDLNAASTPAWLGLGKAALALNDLQRAEGAIRRALSLSPENADAHLSLGYLRLKQDRASEAIRSFRMASQLNPEDAVSLCMIGHVYEKQGKPGEALAWYGRALKVNPRDELALRLMATAQISE